MQTHFCLECVSLLCLLVTGRPRHVCAWDSHHVCIMCASCVCHVCVVCIVRIMCASCVCRVCHVCIVYTSCAHHVCIVYSSVFDVEWILMVCNTNVASYVAYYPACYALIIINLQVAACELLHAMVLFLIGKSAQPAMQKKVEVTGNEKG